MTRFLVTASFDLDARTPEEDDVRRAVEKAVLDGMLARGYVVKDSIVLVRLKAPRRPAKRG